MNIEDFRAYCLSLDGVTEKIPFGKFAKRFESTLVFYVLGHMFCIVDIDNFTSVTVRSTPEEIENLRQTHVSVEAPVNPTLRYWIKLNFNGDISDSEIYGYVNRAYEIVKTKYSTKTKPTKG